LPTVVLTFKWGVVRISSAGSAPSGIIENVAKRCQWRLSWQAGNAQPGRRLKMSELALLLIGAGIALVSGLIGAWMQHFLSLRADRITRDKEEKLIGDLSDGAKDIALQQLSGKDLYLEATPPTEINQAAANLERVDLERVDLWEARLERAHLEKAILAGARLAGAILAGAHLAGANLAGAHLVGANLERAYLAGAQLVGANLERAHLAGANLVGAHLAGANLAGANLGGAHLERAYLAGADLRGANLVGANLERAHLAGAKYNDVTEWPDDFNSVKAGATKVED
jgi:uncharacterized protein YjbI with pentapeptide repeats